MKIIVVVVWRDTRNNQIVPSTVIPIVKFMVRQMMVRQMEPPLFALQLQVLYVTLHPAD